MQTGIDRSIELIPVLMEKTDAHVYPMHSLPSGYRFCFYEPGLEKEWAELECAAGEFTAASLAAERFQREFIDRTHFPSTLSLSERMVFVLDTKTTVVGTAALWEGGVFGETRHRLHWLAVHPRHQGKGLAKAVMTKLFEMYNELGLSGSVYLTTQTWSYRAVNIYLGFGFQPYRGKAPKNWKPNPALGYPESENFEKKSEEAWLLIQEKISQYRY